jgi:hypothetical protein
MQATTASGTVINFDPNRVHMLTGPVPSDGQNVVFYIHGISPDPIPQMAGTMAAFVATMPNATHFVQLTFSQNNAHFYANAKDIHLLSAVPAQDASKFPGANAVIALGHKHRHITQTVADAKTLIDAAGGTI